ncbi:hypothetical protein [Streptomyces sp. 021-4]|uniref:hypothetical protein n=1 Tax=Streptomyces sp. 021-4 TaxID=2789260 RepID=UPI0039F56A2A
MSRPRLLSGPAAYRPWVERTDLWAKALRGMDRRQAVAVLAKLLYNASDELIAQKLDVTAEAAHRLSSIGLSQLRHPTRLGGFANVLLEAEAGALVIDKGLRSLLDSWRMEEMFGTQCAQCRMPLEIPFESVWGPGRLRGRRGRPRSYCSDACRQKAYRMRRRAALDGQQAE